MKYIVILILLLMGSYTSTAQTTSKRAIYVETRSGKVHKIKSMKLTKCQRKKKRIERKQRMIRDRMNRPRRGPMSNPF